MRQYTQCNPPRPSGRARSPPRWGRAQMLMLVCPASRARPRPARGHALVPAQHRAHSAARMRAGHTPPGQTSRPATPSGRARPHNASRIPAWGGGGPPTLGQHHQQTYNPKQVAPHSRPHESAEPTTDDHPTASWPHPPVRPSRPRPPIRASGQPHEREDATHRPAATAIFPQPRPGRPADPVLKRRS